MNDGGGGGIGWGVGWGEGDGVGGGMGCIKGVLASRKSALNVLQPMGNSWSIATPPACYSTLAHH